MVQCLFASNSGEKNVQVRVMLHGSQTVLGDAADDSQLFATDDFDVCDASTIKGKVAAERQIRDWDVKRRVVHSQQDEERRAR